MFKKILAGLFFCLFSLHNVQAAGIIDFTNKVPGLANNTQPEVLPAEEAFKFLATFNADRSALILNWQIASDYYLYRDKLNINIPFAVTYTLPAGEEMIDEFFGNQVVYFNNLAVTLPLPADAPEKFALEITYQGCATAGFCYPPITEVWEINHQQGTAIPAAQIAAQTQTQTPAAAPATNDFTALETTPSAVTDLFKQHQTPWILMIFYGLGLLLTFTPCVLPMIPILSSIIVGQNTTPRSWHSFSLSLSYVSGMIITYTLAGIFAGLAGQTLQAYLQAPWFIGVSALLLVLLSLSLFGFYRLQLPAALNNKMHQLTHRMHGGRYFSALILGVISALIVSPCVTAPLIGALTYISTTGDAALGGGALFALASGMGTPLLIIGTVGPRLLPQAGEWLIIVQRVFGVLLVGVAIWLLSRLLSPAITLAIWGTFAIISASYLGALQTNVAAGWPRFWQACGWIVLLIGILLITRASQPLLQQWLPTHSTSNQLITDTQNKNNFIPVKTWEDVQRHIQQSDKPVLLDIYAEWCITCKIIEQKVFPDPQVAALLTQFTLLRADVTAQDAADRALQKQLTIFAPPALLFFAPQGTELANARLVGDITPQAFTEHLQAVQKVIKE